MIEEIEEHETITRQCYCCLCDKPVTVTVLVIVSTDEDCDAVICESCASQHDKLQKNN